MHNGRSLLQKQFKVHMPETKERKKKRLKEENLHQRTSSSRHLHA
ncbi:hypothetical protein AAZX31_02G208400 [Glycine max]